MSTTPDLFRPVKAVSKLSEQVEAQLERVILSGAFKVNGKLPTEADLGAAFGVSRTVIREAIQRLEAQGLVRSKVGRGSFVAPYPMSQVRLAMSRFAALNVHRDTFLHLLDLRLVIETETTGRVAQRRDPTVANDLQAVLGTMRETVNKFDDFAQADMEFHLRIARGAGNPFFAEILEPLKDVGRAFGLATYASAEGPARVCREHAGIVEAIAAGDVAAARDRVRKHIEFSRSHYIELLEQAEAATPAGSAPEGNEG